MSPRGRWERGGGGGKESSGDGLSVDFGKCLLRGECTTGRAKSSKGSWGSTGENEHGRVRTSGNEAGMVGISVN